jgi:tol-pal system protein YbgF
MPMFDGGTRRLRAMCAGVVATALVGLVCVDAAQAQQAGQPRAQTKAATPAPQKAAPSEAASGGEAGLRQRVEQLEEQLVDLQVVIGTLESLAKTTGGPAGPAAAPQRSGGFAPSDTNAGRIDGIEVQIKALTAQVEQLAEQVRAGDGRRAAVPPPPGRPGGAPAVAGFGSTTVSGASDPVARVISGEAPPPGSSRQTVASAPVAGDAASAKQLYETAYGYLLQQNYGAAEAAFDEFLQKHPGDALAGNAQYWLGESHFVRGNYKVAASAFLKGYQTYAKSAKAPDSLLKLAMSLDRLGQRDAACTSFNELNQRFPQAPTHVRTRADSERRRLGCA